MVGEQQEHACRDCAMAIGAACMLTDRGSWKFFAAAYADV